MKNAYTLRYFVTDVVSIPVIRLAKKGEAYQMATKSGWGAMEWEGNVKYCIEDTSVSITSRYGNEFHACEGDEIISKDIPTQAETETIIVGDGSGFTFWEAHEGDVKIFVSYDENGLIDTYRLDNWNGKPEEGETEITFNDLQSEEENETTDRAEIEGTHENYLKYKEA